jgi:hypothetical protein
MKNRLIRLGLVAGVALLAAAPAVPAHAWSCTDEVGQAACFVVGTTCRTVPEKYQSLCTFG